MAILRCSFGAIGVLAGFRTRAALGGVRTDDLYCIDFVSLREHFPPDGEYR